MTTRRKPRTEDVATVERARGADAPRRRAVREAFASAAECVGPIEPGMSLFAVTRGQFSMIDVVNHLMASVGPCQASIWTWAIADYEVEVFTALLESHYLTGAILVVDRSAEVRNAQLIDRWRQRFGRQAVRVCQNHAKIARIWTDEWRFLARGSMNLNFNPRFEQFDVTEGGADFDLVRDIECELPVLMPACGWDDASVATGVTRAFELSQLDMFRGIKTWAK